MSHARACDKQHELKYDDLIYRLTIKSLSNMNATERLWTGARHATVQSALLGYFRKPSSFLVNGTLGLISSSFDFPWQSFLTLANVRDASICVGCFLNE